MVVEAAHDEQGGHGGMLSVEIAIRKDKDVRSIGNGPVGCSAEAIEGFFQAVTALIGREKRVEGGGFEARQIDFA